MNDNKDKKSIIKIAKISFKWITKLDAILGNIRNIVLVVIAIVLMIIANNSGYLRKIYYSEMDVNVTNTPNVRVKNLYEISR